MGFEDDAQKVSYVSLLKMLPLFDGVANVKMSKEDPIPSIHGIDLRRGLKSNSILKMLSMR